MIKQDSTESRLFAVVPEIISKENCEGDRARVGKVHADTVCTGQIRSVTACVEGAGQVERVPNAETVLQENSLDEIDIGSGSVY